MRTLRGTGPYDAICCSLGSRRSTKNNAKLVSESENAKKMLSAHREQMNTLQAKHKNQIFELQAKLSFESDLSIDWNEARNRK